MREVHRGLGRGIDALIPQGEAQAAPSGLLEVDVARISPNPAQPRQVIASEELADLTASIKRHGVLQPLVVTRTPDGNYQLVAGERRWRASQAAGLQTVPVVVKDVSGADLLELALVENIQRADLSCLEEAAAYRQLIEEFGLTQDEVARRVGKSRVTVTNALRLLNLPPRLKDALFAGDISEGHARAMLGAPSPTEQELLLDVVLAQGLSVRQTEELVRRAVQREQRRAEQPDKPAPDKDPETAAVETRLRDALGTKVDLLRSRKGGRLVIHFYSDEELQSLYDRIAGE